MLETIYAPDFKKYDQWQVQLFAHILQKARVALHSEIPPEEVRDVHLEPVEDVAARLSEELASIGPDAPIAVLPEGPMTVPYLERAAVGA
jgi:nickel-dependent lactate racemase